MTTAANIINESLMLLGILADGETPSASMSQTALRRLNSMVASFNNESLAIYQVQDETFTLGAGVTSRTIGSGGNFNTTWPITILPSSFVRDTVNAPNVDFPLQVVNQAQYNSIVVKSITGPYPQVVYYDRSYPLGRLYFWPVPVSSVSLHLGTWKPLTDFTALTTDMALPPGYEEMLTFNLAMRLAPSYGVTPSAEVKQFAVESKRNIKRSNNQNAVLDLPATLPGMYQGGNWLSFYQGNP